MPIITRAQSKFLAKSESELTMLASKPTFSESAPPQGSATITDALASAPPRTSREEYVGTPHSHHSRHHDTSVTSSVSSTATIKARQLAAKAEHARRLAEIDERMAKRERAVADIELQAELAAIEMSSSRSSRVHEVQNWDDAPYIPTMQSQDYEPQVTTCVQSQATACASQQATAYAPQQATAYALPQDPQATACALPHATACALPHAMSGTPPQQKACTSSPLAATCASPQHQVPTCVLPFIRTQAAAQPLYLPTHIPSVNCNDSVNKTNNVGTQDSFITLANVIADLGKKKFKVCDIPKFDGRAVDWLPFKKAFEQSSSNFTAAENISRLSAALQGQAKEAVAMLLVSADDPNQVILALENRFAQPEFIVLQQLSLVRALPKLGSYEATRELNIFACRIRNCVEVIRLLKKPEYLASPELANTVIGKLTPLLRSRWIDFAETKIECGKFKLEILADFLEKEANLQVKFGFITTESTQFVKSQPGVILKSSNKVYAINSSIEQKGTTKSTSMCKFCQAGVHEVNNCEKFALLDIDSRWQWVLDNKVCRRCLKRGSHRYRTCSKKCDVDGCTYNRRHHSLLHRGQSETMAHVNVQSNNLITPVSQVQSVSQYSNVKTQPCSIDEPQHNVTQSATIAHSASSSRSSSLKPHLKVIAVTITGPEASVDTYALLDDGSSTTLLDQSVADLVGAKGTKGTLHINCIGGLNKEMETNFTNIKIKGRHSVETYEIRARAIHNLCIGSQSVSQTIIKDYDYLNDLADVLSYDEAKPMILIGADNWHLLIPQAIRIGFKSQPAAVLTALGWVLFGFIPHTRPVEFVNHISVDNTDSSLDAAIKEYYKLDSIGIIKKDFRSSDDQRALDILEQTTQRLSSGRFQTGLLWRDNIQFVPKSRELALSRFASLERKFAKDKSYADSYKQIIKATIDKGYAELCSGPPSGSVTWYLPHFGVVHPHKKKLRVVHDCAAKCATVCLNSLLLSGPDLLQPLLAIVMRFREGRVALTADIREMFPQIKIRPEDRDAQRFLWRDHPDLPLQEYRMSSMIFGATSSPCTALYLKNKNASDFQHSEFLPEAVRSIIEDHYMDDLLASFDDDSKAARIAHEVMMIHKAACFDMRAWVSNHEKALSLIPSDLHAIDTTEVGLGPTTSSQNIRVLGLTWNVAEDSLCFVKSLPKLPISFTKRTVLSLLMSIYDPVGFMTPIIIKGRILFQKTWKLGIDWDQVLSDTLIIKWTTWFQQIEKLVNISIPRCYFRANEPIKEIQLHLFADASQFAYACVGYWRFTLSDNSVKLSLIGGKARLAPLKPVSIPRLELQAALIAARYAVYVTDAHRRKPNKVFFWSDSLTVLKWLRSDPCMFKAFVAFRVGEISEISNIQNWRYVPTTLNVADDATRDIHEFTKSSRWFTGPSFLLLPQLEWPCEPTTHDVSLVPEELKRNSELVGLLVERQPLPSPVVAHPEYFSSWIRLLRATGRVHLCANTFLSFIRPNSLLPYLLRCERNLPLLSVDILNLAERHLFWKIQIDSFADEILCVDAARPVSHESRLKNDSLLIGEDRLLKLSGRTGASSDVESHPIVLDGKHQITKLLIHSYHVKFGHANNELVVNELRQRFFILSLRPTVRQVSQRCQFCRNRKTKPSSPPVGDLPNARISHHVRPFTYVGLDYFGPVKVTIGRRSEKRWIALFTCMTVRAVHLEVVTSLSSDSAIMAIRRFIARRGCPTRIYSDNGTSFVGAAKLLSELYIYTSNNKIDWRFIPPSAPFMGGCWERLIRSIKTSISVTLKERAPKEEVLNTLLVEAEAIVNSRPLTHVCVDMDSDHAITPFSFLIGTTSFENLPLQEFSDSDLDRRANWRRAQRLADHLWQRFVKEYLPTLVPRNTVVPQVPVKIGDLVLVADGTLPRGCWPRGKIVAVYPGRDKIVRVVDVATKGGVLRRPVKKLALLAVSD